jgi:hypothetical protein
MRHRILLYLLIPLLAACAGPALVAAPTATPMVFQPTLGRALAFLTRQYDGATGLLHPSPEQAVVVWLAPDNLLVEWVLQEAHAAELSVELETSLERYGITGNGLLETIKGEVVTWPPKLARQQEVAPSIWLESYTGEGVIEDWASSADLALFAALNAWNQADAALAQARFAEAMQRFDETGFLTGEAKGPYATAHLALALLVGERIGAPVNDAIVRQLLALQGKDGGFAAHYTLEGAVDGADTATTAYALLALYALRQPMQ